MGGTELVGKRPEQMARLGIAQVPQGRGTFPELTVDENLEVGAYVRKDRSEIRSDIDRWYGLFPRLAERRAPARRQPERRRAADAGRRPGADEPAAAAPARRAVARPGADHHPGLFAKFDELNETEGVTMFIVEQNANLALDIADRAYVLEAGQIVLTGSAADLRADDAVRRAYLGF